MASATSVDPVCGMRVDPMRAAATVRHGGAAYHFCSEGCARRFQASPSRFLSPKAASAGLPIVAFGAMDAPPRAKPATMEDGMGAGAGAGAEAVGWRAYTPLITVFALLLAAVVAMAITDPSGPVFLLRDSIVRFMAGFFLVFAGFKLLDLRGFADGYATYDLLAQKVPAYGLVYPFIELAFGLVMLAGYHGAPLLIAEIVVMGFSGVGVAIKLAKKEPFQCACLGTFLKVPLTKVTLVEDFGMVLLAILLLVL